MSNLSRGQRKTLFVLSGTALILAILWIINENFMLYPDINLEPIVTSFTAAIPIFSLWWPFRPRNRSSRKKGNVDIDLNQKSSAIIGKDEYKFEPSFSFDSMTSAHIQTRFHPDLRGCYIDTNNNYFENIKDVSEYELSTEDQTPDINDIIIIKNRFDNYALLKIVSIDDSSEESKPIIKLKYVINSTGGVNFS